MDMLQVPMSDAGQRGLYVTEDGRHDQVTRTFTRQFSEFKMITASYELAVQNLSDELQTHKETTARQVTKLEEELQQVHALKANKSELEHLNEIIDELKGRINELEANLKKKAPENQDQPKQTDQLNYLSSLQRRDDLIVQGIPNLPNETDESLKQLVVKVASSCGTAIDLNQIKKVHRMERKDGSAASNKPMSILVRLSDESLKDDIFSNYLKSFSNGSGLCLSSVGLDPPTKRIFIKHHLSPELMKVKSTALEMKKDGLIKRVTSKYNQIRIQRDQAWQKITSVTQLDTLRNQLLRMDTGT